MTDYNHKITNGSIIRGEHLILFRAKAIYKAAIVHPYAKDVQCYVNGKGYAIIKMRLTHLEIPDEPVFDIRDERKLQLFAIQKTSIYQKYMRLEKIFQQSCPIQTQSRLHDQYHYVCRMWHLLIYDRYLMRMIS